MLNLTAATAELYLAQMDYLVHHRLHLRFQLSELHLDFHPM
jgi:hypothetical protein